MLALDTAVRNLYWRSGFTPWQIIITNERTNDAYGTGALGRSLSSLNVLSCSGGSTAGAAKCSPKRHTCLPALLCDTSVREFATKIFC